MKLICLKVSFFTFFFQEYSFFKNVDVEPENSESCKSVYFNVIMLVQGSECYRCKDRDIIVNGSDTLYTDTLTHSWHVFGFFPIFSHVK